MTIRFLSDSRHGDWRKGQLGTITKTLAEKPASLNTIYVIELEDQTKVWATDKDVEPFNQLALFSL